MHKKSITAIAFIILVVSGCSSLPSVPNIVYQPPVQQGNIISSKTIAQLTHGMSQEQVLQILGEPVLKDPYNNNRWFYVYSYVNNRSNLTSQKRLTLYFNNGALSHYNSNLETGTALPLPTDISK